MRPSVILETARYTFIAVIGTCAFLHFVVNMPVSLFYLGSDPGTFAEFLTGNAVTIGLFAAFAAAVLYGMIEEGRSR